LRSCGPCDGGSRCGSARASGGSLGRRGVRGSMRAGRRGSTGGRSSAGARSIETASAPPTRSDGPRFGEPPTSGLLGGTADRESLDRVATPSAGARVRWEARRPGVSSDLPISVTINTTATTPRAPVPTTKKSARRARAPRFPPTACRHSRNRSSRSRSSDSGSRLSLMGLSLMEAFRLSQAGGGRGGRGGVLNDPTRPDDRRLLPPLRRPLGEERGRLDAPQVLLPRGNQSRGGNTPARNMRARRRRRLRSQRQAGTRKGCPKYVATFRFSTLRPEPPSSLFGQGRNEPVGAKVDPVPAQGDQATSSPNRNPCR